MAGGITRIAVEGFKSIAKRQEIEVAPLTILAGANSSGKSSIMQPLLMLKQTLEATYDPGALKIDGPNVTFTNAEQFLSRMGVALEPQFSVEVATDNVSVDVAFVKGATLKVKEETYSLPEGRITLRPNMSKGEVRRALTGWPQLIDRFVSVHAHRFFLYLSDEVSPQTAFLYK